VFGKKYSVIVVIKGDKKVQIS